MALSERVGGDAGGERLNPDEEVQPGSLLSSEYLHSARVFHVRGASTNLLSGAPILRMSR